MPKNQGLGGGPNYETPRYIFEKLNKKFNFVFDLAASSQNTKCPKFFSKSDDSLSQDWTSCGEGFLWCNPPYRAIKPWVRKAWEEMQKGAKICMLIPTSLGSTYWHLYIINKVPAIYFFNGRIKFIKNGKPQENPPQDNALVIFDGSVKFTHTRMISISIRK